MLTCCLCLPICDVTCCGLLVSIALPIGSGVIQAIVTAPVQVCIAPLQPFLSLLDIPAVAGLASTLTASLCGLTPLLNTLAVLSIIFSYSCFPMGLLFMMMAIADPSTVEPLMSSVEPLISSLTAGVTNLCSGIPQITQFATEQCGQITDIVGQSIERCTKIIG